MKSNYKQLGVYVKQVDIRNTNNTVSYLRGVSSVFKCLIQSKANTIETDMSTYKIVSKNQFVFNPNTARMGDKIPVALNDGDDCIVSQIYPVFDIIDHDILSPEYLMMWFKRPEFDRYARFYSHGSAREIFDWEQMCEVELPVPSIDKQREIVKEYNVLVDRINLNNQLIQKLEEASQVIYKQWFVDFEFPDENGKPYKSNGGKMEFNKDLEIEIPKGWEIKKLLDFCEIKGGKRLPKGQELNDNKMGNPYIKVADMSNSKFIVLNEQFQFVDKETQKSISRYIVSKGDVIISIVGTIGLINVIGETLNNANLTENCVRLTNIKNINSDFIYHYLFSSIGQRIIETKTVGGVQGKLPLYNIQTIPVIFPNQRLMKNFERTIVQINTSLNNYMMQNSKLSDLKDLLLSTLATINN